MFGPHWVAVKPSQGSSQGKRLICVSHELDDQFIVFIPFELVEHDVYQGMIDDGSKGKEKVNLARREVLVEKQAFLEGIKQTVGEGMNLTI